MFWYFLAFVYSYISVSQHMAAGFLCLFCFYNKLFCFLSPYWMPVVRVVAGQVIFHADPLPRGQEHIISPSKALK